MRFVPRTLTARLVVVVVALVALVGVLVATSATLAMRSYLYDKRDNEVRAALDRVISRPPGRQDGFPGIGSGSSRTVFVQPGSLIVQKSTTGAAIGEIARLDNDPGNEDFATLSATQIRELLAVNDVGGHTVDVAGERYRVMTGTDPTTGTVVVLGLPTNDIDQTLSSMLKWFTLLTLLGVGIAGALGTAMVRRQMRPLYAVADAAREVTTQDLSTGDTAIATRVPEALTNPDTEVGQVGSALNTLLDHVDDALSARHRSEQQVRQFVADASHELRTPLSTIHGYAELSRRTPDDPGALGAALNKVETEADRMSALVEDLLLLARLDQGRPLESEEVDLTHLLLEAVTDARVLAPEHRWRLELPDEPVTAIGDEARLHQVVTNLLNNARNHTPAGTTVTVRASSVDGRARIEVHDDGPGLPAELVGTAFERFTRGDSSRTRASGGAGLGLSLVSAISEAHGGTAGVVSRPGDTTFTVQIP